jgi:hypothetical protein
MSRRESRGRSVVWSARRAVSAGFRTRVRSRESPPPRRRCGLLLRRLEWKEAGPVEGASWIASTGGQEDRPAVFPGESVDFEPARLSPALRYCTPVIVGAAAGYPKSAQRSNLRPGCLEVRKRMTNGRRVSARSARGARQGRASLDTAPTAPGGPGSTPGVRALHFERSRIAVECAPGKLRLSRSLSRRACASARQRRLRQAIEGSMSAIW